MPDPRIYETPLHKHTADLLKLGTLYVLELSKFQKIMDPNVYTNIADLMKVGRNPLCSGNYVKKISTFSN